MTLGRIAAVVAVMLLTATMVGCQGPASHEPAASSATPAAAAAPGGEAMCAEHGVLEAVCTKCNPALVPVFKAKGDWCEAHGFPESICPVCHPERGGRPAVDVVSTAEGPADGTRVRFRTGETARLAGLRLTAAVAQPTTRDVQATARVVYDGAKVAQVNPRMRGVVRTIHADVGTRVRAGSPLALIDSAEVGAEQSRLQAARTHLEVAIAHYARVEALIADGVAPRRDLLDARREREDARAEVRSARAALGMVGAASDGPARYTMTAPLAGVVTRRSATIGHLIDPDEVAFEVVDPSTMWIELDVPEADLALVSVGQAATVTFDGLPGREFTGKLAYLALAIDPRTRTAVARFPLPNADGALRANVFGRGRIAVTDPHATVLVPRAAVQRARSVALIFVKMAEDSFEARRVSVAPGPGDLLSVAGRVQAGDAVVTEGSHLLKTETLKESIGAGCCEVD